jgi:hypothetical protein
MALQVQSMGWRDEGGNTWRQHLIERYVTWMYSLVKQYLMSNGQIVCFYAYSDQRITNRNLVLSHKYLIYPDSRHGTSVQCHCILGFAAANG